MKFIICFLRLLNTSFRSNSDLFVKAIKACNVGVCTGEGGNNFPEVYSKLEFLLGEFLV